MLLSFEPGRYVKVILCQYVLKRRSCSLISSSDCRVISQVLKTSFGEIHKHAQIMLLLFLRVNDYSL